ncbi:MAG: autotransporter-associated beta strand repeat-containing protein, partial [Thermoguttaceae bacterium]|nr:autotransporter-associated beta strand repeat-containing protein [Thermoguttaceae bacterium]
MRYMFAPLLRSIVALGLLGSAFVDAAPMYWDTSPDAGLQAGDGQWDLGTTASWSDDPGGSSPLLTWTSSANDAVFQANGTSLVTVFGTNVGADSIVFNGTGYTIGSQRVAVGSGGIVANESATMFGVTLGASQPVTVADGKTLSLQQATSFGSDRNWTKEGNGTLNTAGINVGNTAGTTGTLTMTDGVLNVNGLLILGASVSTSTGILNISGGEINVSNVMYLGHLGNGTVNQTGGTVNLDSSQGMRVCTDSNATSGIYNLDGGVLKTRAIGTNAKDPDNRTMLLSFGGGTLEYTGTGLMTPATQFEFKAGGGTISIPNANASMHVTQEITGTGWLTKTGAGTLIVEGGALGRVIVSGGELIKDGDGTLTVSNSLAAPDNQALFVQSGGTYTHKQGTLNATATYPIRVDGGGVITQEGGTITASGYSVLGRGSGTAAYNMQGGILSFRDLYIGWGRPGVINQSGGTVTVSSSFRIADSISGTGSEYNLSGGSLTVTGAAAVGFRDHAALKQTGGTASFGNLYLGGGGSSPASTPNRLATYTLTDGELTINTSLWVGRDYGFTGKLDIDGGTLTANGDVNIGNVTANDGGATGVVTQTGGQVTINSSNSLRFRATDTHTATYHLNGGTLTLAAINYDDTSTQQFNFGGGTLQANGSLITDMPMTINAGEATIDSQAHTVTLGGELSGDGGLAKLGDGVLTLNGANSYNGTTNIYAGTLRLGHASALGSTAGGTVIHADGTLDLNGQSIQGEAVTVAGTITNTGASQLHALRNVTLSGDATFTGTGRWDIRGAGGPLSLEGFTATKTGNDWVSLVDISINGPGGITVNQGTLGLTRSTWNTGTLTVNSGGTAQFQSNNPGNHSYSMDIVMAGGTIRSDVGVGTVHSAVELTGSSTFRVDADSLTLAGDISGADSLTKTGNGTLVLSGENTYTGGTTVSAGTLRGSTASLQGNIVNNAALVFDQTNDGIFAGAITGTGGLTKLGGGTLTLTGSNNYSGGTTVSDGILRGDTTSLRGSILNNATVVFDQTSSGSYSGALSGTGVLVKLGDGSLGLTGTNTYAGGTTVAGGFLQISSDARLGAVPGTPTVNLTLDGGGVKNNGGALVLDANRTIYLGEGGGWFTSGWSSPTTLNGQITGPGAFTANNDNGPVVLANPANDYAGNTVIGGTLPGFAYNNAGLRLGASEVIPHGLGKGGLVFNASAGGTATLDVNGHTETVNSLSTIGAGASVIDNTTGSGILRVASGDFPGIIRSTGGTLVLEKIGDGTLTLSGANTYDGGATVTGGTLMLSNTSGSGTGSGPVNVGPVAPGFDAILGGTGAIAGTVTIHSGGMHAPGASVGEQAIGGASWNPGGMFQFEINDTAGIAGGGLDGLGWDL